MSRGRMSPRFWWGQTSVNTDTFFSEAAHPHCRVFMECQKPHHIPAIVQPMTAFQDASTDTFPYDHDIEGDDWPTALHAEVGIQPFAPPSNWHKR